MLRLRTVEKMSYFFFSALEKNLSRELPTACFYSDGECPKMALSSKDQALRTGWRKDVFTSTATCYPWPSVEWFVPPYHLARCGCSSVPSPAFHGDPQLCEKKGSIPEFAGWNMGRYIRNLIVCVVPSEIIYSPFWNI